MEVASMAQQAQFLNKIILVWLITAFGCNQPVATERSSTSLVNKTDSGLHMKNAVVFFGEQPWNGTVYTLYEGTTDTAELCNYVNGKEHGEWKRFYKGKKLKEKRWFENGRKTGELVSYWENGTKQMQYFFVHGEYEGSCREWNREGKLIKLMHYKKGYEEGLQQCWYDNGKIKANYIISNGRRYGLLGTKNCINVSDSIFKM
jgi:antitoxin component YwqK of YwqJK toxin-antitoxin module